MFALLALGTALTGCGSLGEDASQTVAQVRLVEMAPGAPDLDLYLNGSGAAYGVGYESFTSYLPVAPGGVTVALHRAGGGQALTSGEVMLNGGHQYTVIATRHGGSLQQHVLVDAEDPAAPGRMGLRIVNEVGGAGTLAFHVAAFAKEGQHGTASRVDVSAGAASSYLDLPADPEGYEVEATLPGAGLTLPVAKVTVHGRSGSIRTVVFGGSLAPGGHPAVIGFVLADADAAPPS